ncbi:MAG: HAMP domain-containing sensor histidine kinase [Burkholderiaceae bacterium]
MKRPQPSPASEASAVGRSGRRLGFPSLGARLVGLFVVFALAVSTAFLLGLRALQHGGWRDSLRPLVLNYADLLVAEIGAPPDLERARLLTRRLPLRIRIDGPDVNWDSADEPHAGPPPRRAAAALPGGEPMPLLLPAPRRAAGSSTPTSAPHAGPPEDARPAHPPGRRLTLRPDLNPNDWRIVRRLPDGTRFTIGLADLSHEERARRIGWTTLAALLALTALAYAGVRRMLHPIAALRAGAVRYGQGDFSRPIVPRRRDELGDLAEQINGMAARLHHMLDAKRQLLLAISHELRSPLARARLNAELIDDSDERRALLRDLGEMRDLITDLLESERLADMRAGGHAALKTEPTTLCDLVRAQCGAQAAAGEVTLRLAGDLPALALDRPRMRLLLRNLVDNALRHGAGAMAVPQVSTSKSDDGATLHLVVRDHGPGMGDAQLRHAGEAFYRADAARQRSTGGVGLGLHLCRLVAQAHGGALSLRNAGPGLEIDVAFPMPPTAAAAADTTASPAPPPPPGGVGAAIVGEPRRLGRRAGLRLTAARRRPDAPKGTRPAARSSAPRC